MKFTFEGLDIYSEDLVKMGRDLPKMMNAALYDGAAVLANEVQKEIDSLRELEQVQRQGLHDGMGISKFWTENGMTVTKIGFDGYNKKITKRWPKGQPNAMIARSTIRGTSWMRPNRFTNRAAKNVRRKCVEVMAARFESECAKYTK